MEQGRAGPVRGLIPGLCGGAHGLPCPAQGSHAKAPTCFDDRLPQPGLQVCNLAWSKNVNEIVSTHGYSQNQIIVWKYPAMAKLATLTGHTLRCAGAGRPHEWGRACGVGCLGMGMS